MLFPIDVNQAGARRRRTTPHQTPTLASLTTALAVMALAAPIPTAQATTPPAEAAAAQVGADPAAVAWANAYSATAALVETAPPDADPGHPDPAHPDPAHPDPAHPGPTHAGPIYAGPAHTGPIHAGPIHAGPIHAGPIHAGPIHAGPAHTGRSYAGPYGRPAGWREAPGGVVGWRWPVDGQARVVRRFEAPDGPYGAGHRGVDLAGTPGAVVRAAGAGVVRFAGPVGGRGVVSVTHDDGRRTTYEPVRASVRAGDRVVPGTPLGHLDGTHLGCGAETCLHWGLIVAGQYVDPLTLLGPGSVRLYPVTT
ncbi:peptidoglycan DD-metalloendopeptidase family protein [Cryptosporangium sp. NPDC048952]|uniref:peptidoglycan DD-metalloendopeptidase family protein n=1 Tax=Cryptosporangium sp. NPDC048952 TaxID=3363961 RepID=UPI003713E01E